jgi:Putative zinc-finger
MTNCEWMNSRLEAYFCDDLSDPELQRFRTHLETCAKCQHEVSSLKSIDPLLRGVLRHRLALAQRPVHSNGRPRILRLALAAGSLAAALVLLVLGSTYYQETPAPSVAAKPPAVEISTEPRVKKDATPQEVQLSKPLDGTPVRLAPQPHLDTPQANGPAFSITDAAGYPFTLDTYRGRVLLFGVVSPEQKAAVNNLEQIYEAYGSNPKVGIFAVARHREDEFTEAKFPLFFNNGSKLLGVQEGQFILVDPSGRTRLQESLADPANMARIKNEFGELGIR